MDEPAKPPPPAQACDALLAVDVQNDFLPGGALAVTHGDEVIGPINAVARAFARDGKPVFATRDWHPADHCSFRSRGGPWPPHCIAGQPGAQFANALELPAGSGVISKGTGRDEEAYSGFAGTDLAERLRAAGVRRLCVAGLATDYCVLNTVLDALAAGFAVTVLVDAARAVDMQPGDGARALQRMSAAGAALRAASTMV